MTEVWRLDDAPQLGLFGARTLVRTTRTVWTRGGADGPSESAEVAFHASSADISAAHGAGWFGDAVRAQWGVEAYHSVRDGAYCEDIRTRRSNPNTVSAMMVARTVALYFSAVLCGGRGREFKEIAQSDTPLLLRLVTRPFRPK